MCLFRRTLQGKTDSMKMACGCLTETIYPPSIIIPILLMKKLRLGEVKQDIGLDLEQV